MTTATMVFLGIAALMLAFLFVDGTSKGSNRKVALVEFIVMVVALLLALITHVGGM